MSTHRIPLALLPALVLLSSACATPPEEPEGEPYTPPAIQEPDSIGYYLTQLDNQLQEWSELKLEGRTEQDWRTLRALEQVLNQTTLKRKDDLLAELDSPSPSNRSIAAIALGFTRDEEVASPLLNALADPNDLVSHNALLGLGVLASPTTPLARICFILANDPDPYTRSNAAFAMGAIVEAGGRDECTVETCRDALIDENPGVRAQAATILGLLFDHESIQPLGDLLYDDIPLVARASAAALSSIGRRKVEEKGKVARLLMDAASRRAPKYSDLILGEVRRLSDKNYGDDLELWTEWAHRLP